MKICIQTHVPIYSCPVHSPHSVSDRACLPRPEILGGARGYVQSKGNSAISQRDTTNTCASMETIRLSMLQYELCKNIQAPKTPTKTLNYLGCACMITPYSSTSICTRQSLSAAIRVLGGACDPHPAMTST